MEGCGQQVPKQPCVFKCILIFDRLAPHTYFLFVEFSSYCQHSGMVVLSVCVCMYVHIEYMYIFKTCQLEMHALFLGVK